MNLIKSNDWNKKLSIEFKKKYFKNLMNLLNEEYSKNTVFPKKENLFSAFNHTPLEKTKIIILGQDPYHGENQAHGLSFSVPIGQKIPPSLRNIYKELVQDQGCSQPKHGNLTSWARQGVLLLNSTLSVRSAAAGSHQKMGWEKFTDHVLKSLSEEKENLVFFLWGSFAIKKEVLLNPKKHLILKAPHPSPLSAYRGFFGGKYFSKANKFLEKTGQGIIDWSINE